MATGSGGSGLASNHDGQEAASNSAQSGAAAVVSNLPASGPGRSASPPVLGLHREPMYNWQATKSSLKERFAFLFNNELLSDVRFIVGKGRQAQRIPAHKFVLAAGSAVFDAMFNGGMATTSTEIELPDVEPAAFLALLRYDRCLPCTGQIKAHLAVNLNAMQTSISVTFEGGCSLLIALHTGNN